MSVVPSSFGRNGYDMSRQTRRLETHDVAVVGGGFAGVTAARHLAGAGHDVLLIEARDRLGGRVRTSEFAGVSVELGGDIVHWSQPHLRAELTRHGLPVSQRPAPTIAYWRASGRIRAETMDSLRARLGRELERFFFDAKDVSPRPFDLFHTEDIARLGSVQDRLEETVTPEHRQLMRGLFSTWCGCPCAEAELAGLMHRHALAGWNTSWLIDDFAPHTVEGGMAALLHSMAGEHTFEVRLSSPVAAVEQTSDAVLVRTRFGETYLARAVVVAVPLNVLGDISFSPALSPERQAAASDGYSGQGLKQIIHAEGDLERFVAIAPDDEPITWLQVVRSVDDAILLVGYGPDGKALDPNDVKAVTIAIDRLVPGLLVVDSVGHGWVDDEFSRGTWTPSGPCQLMRNGRSLQRPEGRLFFAGSELASGWNGFIDGAIESGLKVGAGVDALLTGRRRRAIC